MNLQDRKKAEKKATPTAIAIDGIMGVKKGDYVVNLHFKPTLEEPIKTAAQISGGAVATYIKMLVFKDLQEKNLI